MDAHSMLEHSRQGGDGLVAIRVAATDDLTVYLEQGALYERTTVDAKAALEEAWFLGLRRNAGVELVAIKNEFGAESLAASQLILASCVQDGLLEKVDDRARLTLRGRLFSNEVFERFLGVGKEIGSWSGIHTPVTKDSSSIREPLLTVL